MRRIIRYAAVSLALSAVLPFGGLADSLPSLTVELIAQGADGKSEVVLEDEDVVALDEGFRAKIQSDRNTTLTVSLKDPDGKQVFLVRDKYLRAGEVLALSNTETWLGGITNNGLYQFIVRSTAQSGKEITQTHRIIAADHRMDTPQFGKIDFVASEALSTNDPTAPSSELSAKFVNLSPQDFRSSLIFAQALRETETDEIAFSFRGAGVAVYSKVAASVVKVLTDEGTGSGSLVSADGKIITNWHVVKGYRTAGIQLKHDVQNKVSGKHIFIADVIRVDEVADLALLKLKDIVPGLVPLHFSNNEAIEIGSNVHAIGHPEGQNWTYTRGYISQIRKDFEWPADGSGFHQATVIQTQTPINPGNSGGPLLDDAGLMLGVNSFKKTKAEGINYAVSLGNVRRLIEATEDRWIERPKLPANYAVDSSIIVRTIDTDKNGVVDKTAVDFNKNGRVDMLIIDKNEDGKPDYFISDANENGRWDTKITPVMKDGKMVFVWAIDQDENGKIDAYCIDTDADFKVDKCRKA